MVVSDVSRDNQLNFHRTHITRRSESTYKSAQFLHRSVRPFLTGSIFQEIFGRAGSKIFLGNICPVHDLKISDRLLRYNSVFNQIPGFIWVGSGVLCWE